MGEQSGSNVIFLISQPRAGSTLLQKILASHPDIHTVEEPWVLLPLIYELRNHSSKVEYDATLAQAATNQFLKTLPEGEADYLSGVGYLGQYLYNKALEGTGKKIFLDKTPRYYLIIPEIAKAFPGSKIILLIRNPLAVLASMVNTWTVFLLYKFKHDLLQAPDLLAKAIQELGDRVVVIHFEKFILKPYETTEFLCEKLGIPFSPDMIEYGRFHNKDRKSHFGDKESVDKYSSPQAEKQLDWMNTVDLQTLRLMQDYLKILKPDTLATLGFKKDELALSLNSINRKTWFTLPMFWFLAEPANYDNVGRKYLARITRNFKRTGPKSTINKIIDQLKKDLFFLLKFIICL